MMLASVSFFWGFVSGFFVCLLSTVMVLRWGWRNRELLVQLIKEVYHIDLLPWVCRIEGLLNLALTEWHMGSRAHTEMYVEKALEETRSLKKSILEAVERYTKYQ